jgi:hypothetical protein
MNNLLKEYINQVIDEQRSGRPSEFKTAGDRKAAHLTELEKYVRSEPPYHYIHLSSINKVGINPRYGHETPLGIYAWILTPLLFEHLKNIPDSFSFDRGCLHILEANASEEELMILQKVGQADIKRFINWIRKDGVEYIPETAQSANNPSKYAQDLLISAKQDNSASSFPSLGGTLWRMMSLFCHKDMKLWRRILLKMGYKGVLDVSPNMGKETGIIYLPEPMQAVFFSKEYITQVVTIQNPSAKSEKCGETKTESDETLLLGLRNASNINTRFLDFYWDKIRRSNEETITEILQALINGKDHKFSPYIELLLELVSEPSDILYNIFAKTSNGTPRNPNEVGHLWEFWRATLSRFISDYDKGKFKRFFGIFIHN